MIGPIQKSILLLSLTTGPGCTQKAPLRFDPIRPQGMTVETRFVLPDSFERARTTERSFERFVQTLPLKPHGSKAAYHDRRIKPSEGIYLAVVDWPVGDKDLMQCADAIIKIRAEYFYGMGSQEQIVFNFTNGFACPYKKYSDGYRVDISGNTTWWEKKSPPEDSRPVFESYLELVYTYAGTRSLERELTRVDFNDMRLGDVLIQGGSPGHAVIVVDMARHVRSGMKIYALAQSFMPAQEIQILLNPGDPSLGPWYVADDSVSVIETPEWSFSTADLRRFIGR